MRYLDLNVFDYVYNYIKRVHIIYGFENKNILFLFLNETIDNVKLFLKLGAKHVWFVNPEFDLKETENGQITKTRFDRLSDIPDNSVDLVIGIEILEHFLNLEELKEHLLRVTKHEAKIELQGQPLWTSPKGNHVWLPKYKFNEDSNPFEPWEHLIYSDNNDMCKGLVSKGFSETDAKDISDWIYDDKNINRIPLNQIMNAFVKDTDLYKYKHSFKGSSPVLIKNICVNNIETEFINYTDLTRKNKFFEIAKEKYAQEELTAETLVIKMQRV